MAYLQKSLASLGFDPGPIDGDFGPQTLSAVLAFQAHAGIAVDGICGPLTWGAIDGALRGAPSRGGGTALRGKTIVLDAGHGGDDPGAVSPWGDKEKDFTLPIVYRAKKYLEDQGARVILTRYGDYAPGSDWNQSVDELLARVSIANSQRADIFVSVHINAYDDPAASGVMGFYRTNSSESASLAACLAQAVNGETGLRLIDVQGGPYYVLNHTRMPAALVEIGFMTNWGDVQSLRKGSFQDEAGRGVAAGILDYLGR